MLLTTPGRVNEIVWAVEKLTASPDYADRLVTAAREYVEAHTWQETAGVTSELYSRMLSNAALHAKGVSKRWLVDRVNSSKKVEDLSPQRSMRVFPAHEQENTPAFSTTRQRRAA